MTQPRHWNTISAKIRVVLPSKRSLLVPRHRRHRFFFLAYRKYPPHATRHWFFVRNHIPRLLVSFYCPNCSLAGLGQLGGSDLHFSLKSDVALLVRSPHHQADHTSSHPALNFNSSKPANPRPISVPVLPFVLLLSRLFVVRCAELWQRVAEYATLNNPLYTCDHIF